MDEQEEKLMSETTKTIDELVEAIRKLKKENSELRAEVKRLRDALLLIYGVAGNKANPEADKAVIRGVVTDTINLEI